MPERGQTELSSPEFIYNSAEANIMHLSSASPREGGPRAMCQKIGDFVGTLQRILAALVWEIWGL